MSVASENKTLRHYRIQQMYKELESYKLSSQFIEEVLCSFFTVGPATIYLAMKSEEIKMSYEYLSLDKEWAAGVVKIIQSAAYRKQKKQQSKADKTQYKLAL